MGLDICPNPYTFVLILMGQVFIQTHRLSLGFTQNYATLKLNITIKILDST